MKKLFSHPFKKWVITSILTISTFSVFAANIHIAKNGVNALTDRGTSSAPYQTINYVFNNGLINTGDHLVLHEGVYRETVVVNINGITIRPRVGDHVTISGANWYGANSWSDPDGDGVFELTLNTSQVETDFTQLLVNGQHRQIARFPNNTSPYKNYVSGSNREMMDPRDQKTGFAVLLNGSKPAGANQTGQVTFSWHGGTPKLPNVTFTNEAIVRGFIGKLRNNIFSYSQDGGQVARAGDRKVTFKSFMEQGNIWGADVAVTQPEGFGYIMDYSVLDYEGEWFWRKTQNKMYYKPVGGTVIGKNFEIQRRQYVLKVQANNVSVEDIDFKVGEVELKNANTTNFTNCTFTYLSPYQYRRQYGVFRQGVLLNNADNTNFESCYIGHTWGSGVIILKGSDNTKINNCYIEDIGWMGQFTVAIENNGNNTQITKNSIGKASRFHIRTTESVYMKITDNDFYGAMSMGEDAGAIMFTSTGRPDGLNMQNSVIAWNKIHDMKGIPAYDPQDYSNKKYLVALYLEDTDNYTVHHNLIYGLENEYTSVRLKGNGTPETTKNINCVTYLGPRTKKMNNKIHFYNNTCWGYNRFFSFWRIDDGEVNALEVKNNLIMNDKENYLDHGQGAENKLRQSNFFTFTEEVDEYGINIVSGRNKSVVNAADHYVDANNDNFRLKTSSAYNNDGLVISGITTETTPAIGAWEGAANWQKERVFNAGSTITSATFNSVANNNSLETDNVYNNSKSTFVYPNPFENQLTVSLGDDVIGEATINVYSVNGVKMISRRTSSNQVLLNTSFLSSGIYVLEIIHEDGRIVEKLVK